MTRQLRRGKGSTRLAIGCARTPTDGRTEADAAGAGHGRSFSLEAANARARPPALNEGAGPTSPSRQPPLHASPHSAPYSSDLVTFRRRWMTRTVWSGMIRLVQDVPASGTV